MRHCRNRINGRSPFGVSSRTEMNDVRSQYSAIFLKHLASPEIGQAGGYGVPARGTDGFGTPCARDGAVSASPARLGGRSKIDLASSDRPTLL